MNTDWRFDCMRQAYDASPLHKKLTARNFHSAYYGACPDGRGGVWNPLRIHLYRTARPAEWLCALHITGRDNYGSGVGRSGSDEAAYALLCALDEANVMGPIDDVRYAAASFDGSCRVVCDRLGQWLSEPSLRIIEIKGDIR